MTVGTRLGLKLSPPEHRVFLSRRDSGVWGWSERGVAGAWSRTLISPKGHAVVGSRSPTILFEG